MVIYVVGDPVIVKLMQGHVEVQMFAASSSCASIQLQCICWSVSDHSIDVG